MCGLFGLFTGAITPDVKERGISALRELAHRGPDQEGVYTDEHVFMGHTRLSIMDLTASGTQPMVSRDQDIIISVNGEIYNFEDLRSELGTDQFQSVSDSEVVLHGYKKWGIDKLLKKLEGMFALAIYDRKIKKVFLARDRVGIKPLYFGQIRGQIFWSSELKSIEKFFESSKELELDKTALYDFLTYLYVPTPKSLYKNVYKLEPGKFIAMDVQGLKISKHTYWELKVDSVHMPHAVAKERVLDILSRSVKQQMMSHVDVGFFLSGGMDSSVVVCAASELGYTPSTYSIGYREKSHDETIFSKIVADHVQSKHVSKLLLPQKDIDLPDLMQNWFDEPFADTSALPTFEVSKLARQGSTVVLTGDGGDELFGGYRWYTEFHKFTQSQNKLFRLLKLMGPKCGYRTCFERQVPSRFSLKARKFDKLTYTDDLQLYSLLLGSVPWKAKQNFKKYFEIEESYDDEWYLRKFYNPEMGPYKSLQYLDFHTYLPDDILTKVDRVSMAVGLEARVPLLATELIEFCFSLDEKVLHKNGGLKSLLKEATLGLIPGEISDRNKRGFSIPMKSWKNDILGEFKTMQEAMIVNYK